MSYKSCFTQPIGGNKHKIHLWDDKGYHIYDWFYPAFEECDDKDAEFSGLKKESLKKVTKWDKENPRLHFHDMRPYQRFLIDKYGDNDEPSKSHKEVFFDIEC